MATKIYLDVHKEKDIKYIEDEYSSADIVRTSKDEFISMIKSFGKEIHSCYSPFINHIGRFNMYYGENWFGEDIEIYANENAYGTGKVIQYHFNAKSQLENFPFDYFY